MNRRFARGIGVDKRAAEHLGGAGDIADLVVHIGGGDRRVLFAAGEQADCPSNRLKRTDGTAHHEQRRDKPDQHTGNSEDDALPFIVGKGFGKIVGQHATSAGTYVPQQFGHPSDLPAFGAQNFPVDPGNLSLGPRDGNDRVGVGINSGAKRRFVDRKRPHPLSGLLRSRGLVRQQRFGNLVLHPKQVSRGDPVRHFGDRRFETLAHRRQCRDQFRPARNQSGNALDSVSVVLKPSGGTVDHLLLIGGKLQPCFLQKIAQRGSRFPDLAGWSRWIGHEVPCREPQFVHAPVDVLRQIAKTLKPLQLGKGRIDVADGDDAGDARHHDHRQQQHETGKG